MKIVSTFHAPSSVSCSLVCSLTPDAVVKHLVVAKTDRLEIHALLEGGLKRVHVQEIWGRVVAIREIAAAHTSSSNLLVLTDHPEPNLLVLSYQSTPSGGLALATQKCIPLHERNGRQAEFFNDVIVDYSREVAVVSCYTGKLKVVTFKHGAHSSDFDVSTPELNILSLCFLHVVGEYQLAILHRDYQQRTQLLARSINIRKHDLSHLPSTVLPASTLSEAAFPLSEEHPPKLLSVRAHETRLAGKIGTFIGGVLVVGGRKIYLHQMISPERQEKHWRKASRTEAEKRSATAEVARKAEQKEKERAAMKRKADASVQWPWSEVSAWCYINEGLPRFILGDVYGRLAMVVINVNSPNILFVLPLGHTSPPTTLTHLSGAHFYLGSHSGNHQLLQIVDSPSEPLQTRTLPIGPEFGAITPSTYDHPATGNRAQDESARGQGRIIATQGTFIRVKETFENVAPILDAVLADTDGSGQPHIVTCSGDMTAGALKVLRKGADFQLLASVDGLAEVTGIWPIRPRFHATSDSHVLLSTGESSHLFSLDDTEVLTPIDGALTGFRSRLPTLALSNMVRRTFSYTASPQSQYVDSPLVVQVTEEEVVLVEYDETLQTHQLVTSFRPRDHAEAAGREIVAASASPSQVIVALGGGRLLLLMLDEYDTFSVMNSKDIFSSSSPQISAVSCSPLDPSKHAATYVAVAFWGSHHVEVLRIGSAGSFFTSVCKTEGLPSLPRSLLLYDFGATHKHAEPEYHPFLLVGLADGSLATFAFSEDGNGLADKKIISLGTTPVSLSATETNGRPAVCACGSRASVFFFDQGRLHHSAILLQNIRTVASLNSAAFSSCIALATPSGLFFGKFSDLEKIHIRSIPLDSNDPTRLVHHGESKTFAVACVRNEAVRVGEIPATPQSTVKLLDDLAYHVLDQYPLDLGEIFTVLATISFKHGKEGPSHFLCAGAVSVSSEDPCNSRLLVLDIDRSNATTRLRLAAAQDIKGCIYALASFQGMLAAAIDSSVVLYRLEKTDVGTGHALRKFAEWNHNYFVTNLSVVPKGDRLVLGDAISSITVVELDGSRLKTVSRDYSPLCPVSLCAAEDGSVVGANADCNLFSFTMREDAMDRDGIYHLGDIVNKVIPVGADAAFNTVSQTGGSSIAPKHLFFSSTGRIGMLFDTEDTRLLLRLTELQRNMASVLPGPGGISHARWRAPVNYRGRTEAQPTSTGFLDGDFLEQFLTLDPSSPELARILSGENDAERLQMTPSQIRSILERLQSMH